MCSICVFKSNLKLILGTTDKMQDVRRKEQWQCKKFLNVMNINIC